MTFIVKELLISECMNKQDLVSLAGGRSGCCDLTCLPWFFALLLICKEGKNIEKAFKI